MQANESTEGVSFKQMVDFYKFPCDNKDKSSLKEEVEYVNKSLLPDF